MTSIEDLPKSPVYQHFLNYADDIDHIHRQHLQVDLDQLGILITLLLKNNTVDALRMLQNSDIDKRKLISGLVRLKHQLLMSRVKQLADKLSYKVLYATVDRNGGVWCYCQQRQKHG